MKTNSLLYLLILGLIIQTSCKSTEEITMFKESIEDNAPVRIYKSAPAEHRINLFDNLFIRILTLDPEVNKLYNPGMAENAVSTDQMFGSPTGQYINGYRVGADSMISLPMLGEINLVGLNLKEAEALITEKAKEDLKEPVV
ncbi:MAG: polysaccharide biosynthesis/export family protein, partial [Prolixibacteraceae bacterium]|nr:polysaccharide biosynthesis/export family protein [Prolixibacteraceae bacterium]